VPVLVLDPDVAAKLLKEREAADCARDEVWDGVTVIMPEADVEHDDIAGFFYRVFWSVFGTDPANRIHFRVNVSDRVVDWKKNYRIPDTTLFLAGNRSQRCAAHYAGGPDVALEVVSPDDRSRDKLDFYASIGTREVLIVDRDPWQMELYQFADGRLRLAGTSWPQGGHPLRSSVGPLAFQLIPGDPRPKVKIVHTGTGQEWVG
jgi:Uma2 family endonuclease